MQSRRIFVEKKEQFRVEAASLLSEFNENLSLSLGSLRLINVYDLFGFSDDLLEKSRYSVFGEVVTDTVTDGLSLEGKKYIAVEYIPGQFDQRASSGLDFANRVYFSTCGLICQGVQVKKEHFRLIEQRFAIANRKDYAN